jgi:N-acylneuraminate cytidylyltransferase
MEILAVIPARGGSKGIPRKNIKEIAGRPLIAWMIGASRTSRLVSRTIVSTEDEEIAAVAKSYGAEVPFLRPRDMAQDLSTDVEFLTHALTTLREQEHYEPDIILRLPPTSPLCTGAHIDTGIETLLADDSLDAVRPIHEAPKHPYKLWKIAADGRHLEPFLSKELTGFDEPHNLPRQLFPKVYVHTGAMDVMRVRTVLEQKSTSGRRLGFFLMDPGSSVNIDSPLDFEIAEILLKKREHLISS